MNKTTEALKLAHIWETLHDHGNGKYKGDVSKAQRELAMQYVDELREALAEPVTYKPYKVKLPTTMVGRSWHSEEIQRWLDELPPLYVGPVRSELVKQEPVAWMFVNDDGECEEIGYGADYLKGSELMSEFQPLYAAPVDAKANAQEKYDKFMAECEEPDPIERLRFFCSLAMTGKNWIDVEKFFDDLIAERKSIRAEALEEAAELGDSLDPLQDGAIGKAIRGLK